MQKAGIESGFGRATTATHFMPSLVIWMISPSFNNTHDTRCKTTVTLQLYRYNALHSETISFLA